MSGFTVPPCLNRPGLRLSACFDLFVLFFLLVDIYRHAVLGLNVQRTHLGGSVVVPSSVCGRSFSILKRYKMPHLITRYVVGVTGSQRHGSSHGGS